MTDDLAVRVRVLVLEDDPMLARTIARGLASDGNEIELSDAPRSVLARVEAGEDAWDVVLLDVGLPDMSGIDVLRRFRELNSPASVVMLTGDTTAVTATKCMRDGAFYYLTKPFDHIAVASVVQSAAAFAKLRRQIAGVPRAVDDAADSLLVGTSPAMRRLRAALDRLAGQDVSILIRGESGTGKELVARALHERGARRKRRFVALNCGAIPETLIDSELFGHVKGAFTGATTDRPGVFVEADGGTLFLDEIGDMPKDAQTRLLRVLQEGEVRPVGGSSLRTVDVRLIAATNVDLAAAVEHARFRADLFYRLNVVVLLVPPLRERLDDLPMLTAHFLRKHARPGAASASLSVSPEALDAMMGYRWPGNVRELENALLHAIALTQGEVILPESLPASIAARPTVRTSEIAPILDLHEDPLPPLTDAKRRASAAFEKAYLIRAMERAKGSIAEAARLAGVDRTNFRRLLQRHGIDASRFRP